ncbi:MAG: HlyC/CorC family transporter [Acidimicrobiia bacterium]|nr:HlyC/CorC family transporter [Acidimicrobiia bacterium]
MSTSPLVALLIGLFLIAVFAALAETSLLRATRVRVQALAAEGRRGAQRLDRLQQRLPEVLNAVLLLALLSQIGAASLAGLIAQEWFGQVGVTIASVLLTVVLFVYGEAIPKTYAVRHPESVGMALAGPVATIEWLLRPLVLVLVKFADLQMPGKGIQTGPSITEEELRLLADKAVSEGEITVEDRDLIERAFRLGDRMVDEIMVPRTEIIGANVNMEVGDAIELALSHGHRRLVVFKDDLDTPVGVARLRDLIPADPDSVIAEVMTDVIATPESRRVLDVLEDMQRRRIHLAVVIDEFGGTAGMVTVEDVVEELFGDISQDPDEADIVESNGGWSVAGSLPVTDAAHLFENGDALEGDWSTVAGLVLGHAGRLLDVGESISFGGRTVEVTALRGRRIDRVQISPIDG